MDMMLCLCSLRSPKKYIERLWFWGEYRFLRLYLKKNLNVYMSGFLFLISHENSWELVVPIYSPAASPYLFAVFLPLFSADSKRRTSMQSCWHFPASLNTSALRQGCLTLVHALFTKACTNVTLCSADEHNFTFPGMCHILTYVLLTHRICKEEVIADFEKEVKKVKEVKLYSSRQPGLLQQMETFLLVKHPFLCFDLKG